MIILTLILPLFNCMNIKKTKEIIIVHLSNDESIMNKYSKTCYTIQTLLKTNYEKFCTNMLHLLTKKEYKYEEIIKFLLKKSLDFISELFLEYDNEKYIRVCKIFKEFIKSHSHMPKKSQKCTNDFNYKNQIYIYSKDFIKFRLNEKINIKKIDSVFSRGSIYFDTLILFYSYAAIELLKRNEFLNDIWLIMKKDYKKIQTKRINDNKTMNAIYKEIIFNDILNDDILQILNDAVDEIKSGRLDRIIISIELETKDILGEILEEYLHQNIQFNDQERINLLTKFFKNIFIIIKEYESLIKANNIDPRKIKMIINQNYTFKDIKDYSDIVMEKIMDSKGLKIDLHTKNTLFACCLRDILEIFSVFNCSIQKIKDEYKRKITSVLHIDNQIYKSVDLFEIITRNYVSYLRTKSDALSNK